MTDACQTIEQLRSSSVAQWRLGYGVIQHGDTSCTRIQLMLEMLERKGSCSRETALELLMAADRMSSMGMWLALHMSCARHVYLDGRELGAEDFKPSPEVPTAEGLSMVPAYVGYLLANALSGKTRAWLMGQGQCAAAVDAVNIITRNLDAEQQLRYPLDDRGLSRLCQDYCSFEIGADGRQAAPLGSRVTAYTAGGISESGYPGGAELQYIHMPLPGQELVAFLCASAFEEQRGTDWAPRWWRGEDTGLVMPFVIAGTAHGRQQSSPLHNGRHAWFREHLALNGFDPVDIDAGDPAAFAWAILHMADQLQERHRLVTEEKTQYPILLPIAIAETAEGQGFPGTENGASSPKIHDLMLLGNPATDKNARQRFNEVCATLYVSETELHEALDILLNHCRSGRVMEKDHCLRRLSLREAVVPGLHEFPPGERVSAMAYIDRWFSEFAQSNPFHRLRVGNPDELLDREMRTTLNLLRHRVTSSEAGLVESQYGAVISSRNEEAVISAVLANKQGINMAVCCEAFGPRMLGAMRQEVTFSRQLFKAGRNVEWISVPVIAASHCWESGRNESSHQDPSLSETWLGEMSDLAPVFFPYDAHCAGAVMEMLYQQRGRVAAVVTSSVSSPVYSSVMQARQAARNGAVLLSHDPGAQIQLLALGSCQLQSVLRAARVLRDHGVRCSVVAIVEPGRFRIPRDETEAAYIHDAERRREIIPETALRIFVSHTRAEVISGVLRPLDTGPQSSSFLGYRNRGGTLDLFGMLYVNGQTWAHIVQEAALLLGEQARSLLGERLAEAVQGGGNVDILR